MQKIIPCLWFDKNCEEAINFYVSIFKNSKITNIKRYPEGDLGDPWKGLGEKILTAEFELFGQKFIALDGGPYFKPSGAISFMVDCEDQAEVDAYWERLQEGSDPQTQQCGWIQDKFGFSWQIVPKRLTQLLSDPDKAKADRAMAAMMKMKKIVVADLEKAVE